jgi:hypothetical protein
MSKSSNITFLVVLFGLAITILVILPYLTVSNGG